MNKFEKDIGLFKNLMNKFVKSGFKWGWVNGRCHPEFLKYFSLNFTNTSTLIYYNFEKRRFFVHEN